MTSTEPFWLWQLLGRLHPLIVHFPIGLLCVALLMEVIARGKESQRAIRIMLVIGSFSALLSVVFGLILAGNEGAEGRNLEIHRWAGIATFAISAITLWFHRQENRKVYLSLLILSVVGITIAGHYGAMLTHGEEYLTEVLPGKQNNLAEKNGASMVLLASLGESLSDDQVAALNLEVRTILAHNCYNCHGEAKKKGDLRLDSRDAIMA